MYSQLRKKYVLGFIFDKTKRDVLLMKKSKPEWQKNHLNGVGGKVEDNEVPIEAMSRETKEKTGLEIPTENWLYMGKMECPDPQRVEPAWVVYVYTTVYHGATFDIIENKDEPLHWIVKHQIHHMNDWALSNIKWLVPMAIDMLEGNHSIEKFEVIHKK